MVYTPTRRFVLRTDPMSLGVSYWLNVTVHRTVQELRRSARRCDRRADVDEAAGVFRSSDGRSRYLGIMRLCEEHTTVQVVVHESIHAAVTLAHRHLGRVVLDPYNDRCIEAEELVAYAGHAIAAGILLELGLVAPAVV